MVIHAAPTTVATAGEQTQGEGIWEAPSLGFSAWLLEHMPGSHSYTCLSPAVEQKVNEVSPRGTRKQQTAAVSWMFLHPAAPELCSPLGGIFIDSF